LITQHLLQWRAEHQGKSPATREEKAQFKLQIRDGQHDPKEANFSEAIALSYKASNATTVPSNTRAILDDEAATKLTSHSSKFWILAAAVRRFVEREGLLPLTGTIPDMTSDTHSYIALQEVYQEKAGQDADVGER